MKRLFTFGCSYTYYFWPTWADILSLEYEYYENWALPGLGNRAISERIAECHAVNTLNENDTVIVQWSTHLRNDWHNEKSIISYPGWQTNGNIFVGLNQRLYSKEWVNTFFTERSWAMHTLNHILLTKNFLENLGCTWKMTSLGDLRKLGNDLDANTKFYENLTKDNNDLVMWKRFPEFQVYEDKIWAKNWVDPINNLAFSYKDLYWYFQADHNKEPWYDAHPSPLQHQKWLNDCLRPELTLYSEPLKQTSLIDKCKEIKAEFKDILKFEKYLTSKKIFSELDSWPNPRKGF
jgi:hypothetical protein